MRHEQGFTLLELICVLAILSILGAFGATSLFSTQQDSKDKATLLSDVKNLANALRQARHLAIESGSSSYVCGGINCSGNWSDGFEVRQSSALDTTYRSVLLDHAVHIIWHGFPANKSSITFLPTGLSSYQNGTFFLCYLRWKASIIINQSGRYYTSDIVDIDGESCG